MNTFYSQNVTKEAWSNNAATELAIKNFPEPVLYKKNT